MADTTKPYGDVEYADPGYLDAAGNQASKSGNPGVKRYPITPDKVVVAWSYINQEKNAAQYTPEQLAAIKDRIKAAMKKHGHDVAGDNTSNRQLTEHGFEVLVRSAAAIADVKPKLRQVDMVAAPWEQFAEVWWRGELWNERYMRGCFNGYEDQCSRTRVNREHRIGETIGKVVRADTQHSDGMILTTQLAKTPRGDEALQLAEEDMVGGSLGYYVAKPSDIRLDRHTRRRDVLRGLVDHFAFVEQPAYAAAGVVGVRDPSGGLDALRAAWVQTPHLDEFMHDPLFEWARSEVGQQ